MEDTKDLKGSIMKAAEDTVGNLVYTVVFDVCNEMISAGANQEKALECANSVVSKYLEGGVKVRKKPTPRAKTTKAPAKNAPVDALTAASRKVNNLAGNAVWIFHPDSNEFSYTTSMKLATGYPVRNNLTKKIVMVINDSATGPLTMKDARVAISLGLEIDHDSLQR